MLGGGGAGRPDVALLHELIEVRALDPDALANADERQVSAVQHVFLTV